MVNFKWIKGAQAGLEDAHDVRMEVFVREQGYTPENELDDLDKLCVHVVGFEEGKAVCTARLYLADDQIYHVGRVAVLATQRGKGIGMRLMEEAVAYVIRKGGGKIALSSQEGKAGFYQKMGFRPNGETMLDEGQPHIYMELNL